MALEYEAMLLEECVEMIRRRGDEYGDPSRMHERIARRWSRVIGIELHAWQVARMMAEMKLARLEHQPGHKDSYIDAICYLAIAAGMQGLDDDD